MNERASRYQTMTELVSEVVVLLVRSLSDSDSIDTGTPPRGAPLCLGLCVRHLCAPITARPSRPTGHRAAVYAKCVPAMKKYAAERRVALGIGAPTVTSRGPVVRHVAEVDYRRLDDRR